MFTLKDKVTQKLSRLFADAPNSPSSSSLPSPLDDNDHPPEARLYSTGGKYLPSYFSCPSVGFGGSTSNKHQSTIVSNGDFESQDESVHRYVECRSPPGENKETENNCENDDDRASGGSTSGSEVFEEAADQQSLQKQLPLLMDDSVFISPDLHEFLLSSLPNIVKGCQWVLLYSTAKHGISLRTLIRKSSELSGPCLLIAGDRQGAVFGGLLEGPLKPTSKRKYQGTNQTFVFTTIYGEPRLFRPTGANRYYYMCLNDLLALGGGGNYALCLDGDLLSGTSGSCETFGNLCLAHNGEFELKNVEVIYLSNPLGFKLDSLGFYTRVTVPYMIQDEDDVMHLYLLVITFFILVIVCTIQHRRGLINVG
ncbi:TLD domain-containing protein 2-like [Pyrus ussuriensis x Pyrus communis]|uniref:TLD domain-containing protein 2-like n=1 Tax=Pyrus ussuriensis x Pyrus communis TaxID=2448454 RepID=A0A5N5HJC4_9ROSA|nr:TLD domain-containing protein 2-like [Pyrus ussuriensis x Pyrus communis]